MTTDARTVQLSDGHQIPLLGLGVWQAHGSECVDAVRWALEAGYRHIDTAQAYGNEDSVGEGLRTSSLHREEFFLTTKFFPERKDPVAELEGSLKRLGVDYVDLYIVHWPERGLAWAWPGMERARSLGYARSIGVSNTDAAELNALVPTTSQPPVVNQVQFSPYEYRKGLLDACREKGVALEAYSPLGHGSHVTSDVAAGIGGRIGRTPPQVLLRWCVQRGIPLLAKSTHRERIAENAQIFDFELSGQDMAALDRLDRTGGTSFALEGKWWASR